MCLVVACWRLWGNFLGDSSESARAFRAPHRTLETVGLADQERWSVAQSYEQGYWDGIAAKAEQGIRDDYIILVGGAPLNQEFGEAIGADAYCRDAAVAADTAKQLVSEFRRA